MEDERVYEAIHALTAEVRAFMERLVRIETRHEAATDRTERLDQEIAALRASLARHDTWVSSMEAKLSMMVAAASLAGGAVVNWIFKVMHW